MFWNRNVDKEKLIDYVMKEAIEDNTFAISCFDDLIKRSNNLLSILLLNSDTLN